MRKLILVAFVIAALYAMASCIEKDRQECYNQNRFYFDGRCL